MTKVDRWSTPWNRRRTNSVPSIPLARNSTASLVNRPAESRQIHPQILPTRLFRLQVGQTDLIAFTVESPAMSEWVRQETGRMDYHKRDLLALPQSFEAPGGELHHRSACGTKTARVIAPSGALP